MKKSDWQYLVDSLLFICIFAIAFIGILLGVFLPQGPSAPETSKYFLNLHRHQWGNIHFYLSIAFIALVIIHLVLSWKWIKNKASHIFKKGWKMALIFTAVFSLLVLFFFWAFYPREPGAYEDYGVGAGRRGQGLQETRDTSIQNPETLIVTGKMTLQDLEKATGLPAHQISDALGLPSNISKKETLGRLSKKYGFSLVEARTLLTRLMNGQEALPEPKTKDQNIRSEEREEIPTREPAPEALTKIVITGQMSLNDIQRRTGIPASTLMDKLGIPSNTPQNENLGRLGRIYSFTLQDVRDVVTAVIDTKKFTVVEEHSEEQALTRGRMAEEQTGLLITGQMSLYEVEKRTGIPAQNIIEKLGLPQNVPRGENLGRLRRRYGFTIQEVRDAVASLIKKI